MLKRTLIAIFIVAFCGIIYELLIATFASYVLGDTITQFSLTIGIFIGSMGLGSYLSKYFISNLSRNFVLIQYVLGIVGGLSILVFSTFMKLSLFIAPTLYFYLALIGTLVGLELPLLARMLEKDTQLKEILSHSLSIDNIGSLVASIIFPLFLIPALGMFQTSIIAGILNICAGLILSKNLERKYAIMGYTVLVCFLMVAFATRKHDDKLLADFYQDPIIYAEQTPYQKIVLTEFRDNLKLYLDGQLQFSSRDEHRYHETLVHAPLWHHPAPKSVLILGGGDGLAVREILKYSMIETITLVDLDPKITELAKTDIRLKELNQNALQSKKVELVHQDAFVFLKENQINFDIIIADLPDPNNIALSKLYSTHFYQMMEKRLNKDGIFITQATSPLLAKKTFWSIRKTLDQIEGHILPLHLNVPSFGEWGFLMFKKNEFKRYPKLIESLKYFSLDQLDIMSIWPDDLKLSQEEAVTSDLLNPKIFSIYNEEVKKAGYL